MRILFGLIQKGLLFCLGEDFFQKISASAHDFVPVLYFGPAVYVEFDTPGLKSEGLRLR